MVIIIDMRFNLFSQSDVPEKYRSNFWHLYFDIAWFGVLSGTSVSFLNVYATRLGASGMQIGLLTAMAAVVNLFLAIPAGRWIEKRHTGRAVFWSSVIFRAGYFLWIPLPWLFNEQGQIWALIILAFLMAIPLTPMGVGFNALFAESVPDRFRAQVAGTRNITFAITYMLTSFGAGFILKSMPLEPGYQVVFAIGAFGAALSSYHLFHLKPIQEDIFPLPRSPQPEVTPGVNAPQGIKAALRLDIWGTPFRSVLLALFCFHLTQYLPSPVFPLYNVRVLHLNDSNIGTGTALFYLTVLIGSTQFRRIAQHYGNKKVTGWGAAGMFAYPFLLALTKEVWQFYIVSLIGGVIFAMVNGAYINYMLEKIPAHDRPSHLAWYAIVLNVAILAASFAGPAIAESVGLVYALIIIALLRFLAGIVILRWG
jgi:MFS family permease